MKANNFRFDKIPGLEEVVEEFLNKKNIKSIFEDIKLRDGEKISISDETVLLVINFNEKNFFEEVKEILESRDIELSIESDVYILIILENIRQKVLYKQQASKIFKHVQDLLKSKMKNFKRAQLDIESVVVGEKNLEYESKIRITSRIKSTEVSPLNNPQTNGKVFTANLYDLVELYNNTGDMLFQSNVRIGLEETLGVNTAINRTLKDNPEEFWFLNNGITLIMPQSSLNQLEYKSIRLQQIYDSNYNLNISIINGAQTITAASNFFYNPNYNEKTEAAKEKAHVILRVIFYNDQLNFSQGSSDRSLEKSKDALISRITVALNRQKPIKTQDIAMVTPFVQNINAYYDKKIPHNLMPLKNDEDYSFSIVRRGEIQSIENHQYDLSDLTYVLIAVLAQAPNVIRSVKLEKLLEVTLEENNNSMKISKFKRKDLFTDEINNVPYTYDEFQDEDFVKEFYKSYSFVNSAMKFNSILTEILTTINKRGFKKNPNVCSEYISKILGKTEEYEGEEGKILANQLHALINYGKYHIMCCLFYKKMLESMDKEEYPVFFERVVKEKDFSVIDFSKVDLLDEDEGLEKNIISELIKFIDFWKECNSSEENNPFAIKEFQKKVDSFIERYLRFN